MQTWQASRRSYQRALCDASDLVISAVTASNTLAVTQEVAQFIRPGTIFLDLNSASPGTKQQCAALIDAASAHYVEAGVMTSVPPHGIKVPMLLGSAKAAELTLLLASWGMAARAVSDQLGRGKRHQDVPQRHDQGPGFEPFMAAAIASKHQWVADQSKAGVFAGIGKGASWQDFADRLLAARKK